MVEKIIVIAVVGFVLVMCGLSLYRTFTRKKGDPCSSCSANGLCCLKSDSRQPPQRT